MPGVGTTHHVQIGGHYYMVRPGSYMKKSAPTFGARFSTGDPDFNNLSLWQHWAQRCFIGGLDQDVFADDAMFDEGIGLDTSDHEKVTIARGLKRGTGSNWNLGGSTNVVGWKSIIYNNILYAIGLTAAGVTGKIYKYDPATDGWVVQTAFSDFVPRSVALFDGKMFVGGVTTAGVSKLVYASGGLASWTVATNPAGVSGAIYAMRAFAQRLYVAYGTRIWRMKDDQTWDGNTMFYNANAASESNAIVAMEVHLGFLYMLSKNAHVHRSDGNSTFDMWNWDGQTEGISIRSFDGRLFILTFEYVNTTDAGWGVLYQMSGSAVTQLKRFGRDDEATRIGNLTVYDRKLWYGASNLLGLGDRAGFGVACYDPVEDAHSVPVSNADTVTYARGTIPYPNYMVNDQVFFQGKLFAFVYGHGAFYTPYKYRDRQTGARFYDTTSAGASLVATAGGWLTTSTYDAGTPGVKKLWRKITIDAEIATSTGIVVDYSTNNGASWTTFATISTVSARREFDFYLDNVETTSLKLRITLRTTSSIATPILYGYVVSYMPVPEPNWLWQFTVVLADMMVLLDGTEQVVDTEGELTFLSNLFRTKALTTFVDAEGVSWAAGGGNGVLVYDISFALRDLNQPLEGEVAITLLEAVESYV